MRVVQVQNLWFEILKSQIENRTLVLFKMTFIWFCYCPHCSLENLFIYYSVCYYIVLAQNLRTMKSSNSCILCTQVQLKLLCSISPWLLLHDMLEKGCNNWHKALLGPKSLCLLLWFCLRIFQGVTSESHPSKLVCSWRSWYFNFDKLTGIWLIPTINSSDVFTDIVFGYICLRYWSWY